MSFRKKHNPQFQCLLHSACQFPWGQASSDNHGLVTINQGTLTSTWQWVLSKPYSAPHSNICKQTVSTIRKVSTKNSFLILLCFHSYTFAYFTCTTLFHWLDLCIYTSDSRVLDSIFKDPLCPFIQVLYKDKCLKLLHSTFMFIFHAFVIKYVYKLFIL